MFRIEMHLSDYGRVRLDEFHFYPDETSPPAVTYCSGSPSYCVASGRNFFLWSAGVRALTLLLLKLADPAITKASISGAAKSAASSLDYALSKEPAWLIDFFGLTYSGSAIARLLMGRRNSERKRPGPVEVYINEKLLPRQNLVVYVNGEIPSVDTLRRLAVEVEAEFSGKTGEGTSNVPPANSTICPRDERETSPFVITTRAVREFLDFDVNQTIVSLSSEYLNVSGEPVTFLQLHAYVASGQEIRELTITCPEDPKLKWHLVTQRSGYQRMLVEFSRPLAPGEAKTVSMSYQVDDTTDHDGHIALSLRLPCNEVSIEVSCSHRYLVSKSAIFAERDDERLFGTLPLPTLGKDGNGNSAVRWTMKHPPHGYHYRLFWALEERPSKRLSERMLANAIRSTPDADCSRKTKAKRVRQTVM